ncbi:TPA: transposase [Pseudomonas aeruginosa]|uniref:transposase n=2 Tax=Pseudomonas aeruginosa TaxID=287 RepID=UPI0009A32767|nr:transposase [Pseudomonas aeruginosa]MBG6343165.1 transposase [Pseudomonas aeruginosa]MBG7166956.1 transposase [Pseudomonas aeruginosa]MBH8782165.1 transposase [Pseudomonas aeruginosa]MBI8779870.1 transposase [Pseudomonas aeruginosa]MBI8897960.1 transposase [Pseudomonas aeruginosa]
MTQTRRRFPESFKREAVDQVLAGTPLRHVAETLGIAESLLDGSASTSSKARTQAINQVKALLISAPQPLRERLWRNKPAECIAGCLRLREKATHPLQALTATLRLLAKRWLLLDREVNALDAMLERLTQLHVKRLRSRFGIGPQTAATLLAVAGDNPERLRNEAALAALCGVSPLQASSGKTIRHRLNRGGDRPANNALWTIALARMRGDIRTQAYVERRTREGRTTREIHRCLKRYIVREPYPLIRGDLVDSTNSGDIGASIRRWSACSAV